MHLYEGVTPVQRAESKTKFYNPVGGPVHAERHFEPCRTSGERSTALREVEGASRGGSAVVLARMTVEGARQENRSWSPRFALRRTWYLVAGACRAPAGLSDLEGRWSWNRIPPGDGSPQSHRHSGETRVGTHRIWLWLRVCAEEPRAAGRRIGVLWTRSLRLLVPTVRGFEARNLARAKAPVAALPRYPGLGLFTFRCSPAGVGHS